MRRGGSYLIALTCVMVGVLAFLAGFAYSVVAAEERGPATPGSQALAQTQGERLDPGAGPQALPVDVKPVELFWQVYTVIGQRYRLVGTPGWEERQIVYGGLDGLLRAVGDPYTRFLEPKDYEQIKEVNAGKFEGIGAYLDFAPDKKHVMLAPIAGGPAARAGLATGDLLLEIKSGGRTVNALGIDIEKAKTLIRGPKGTTVELTVGRLADSAKPPGPGNPMKKIVISVVRDLVRTDELQFQIGPPSGHEKETDLGYIHLRQFSEDTEEQLDRALAEMNRRKVKGIVLDLRDNPGGLLEVAIGVASRFVDRGPIVYIQEAGGSRTARFADRSRYHNANRPMVVLVNHWSASASEIVAGALRDKGVARLVGETTFGKGLVQTIIPLDGDGSSGALKITTARYFTPNGTDINRRGITPDVEVAGRSPDPRPFAVGAQKADDPQLHRAVKELRAEIAGRGHRVASGSAL